MMKSRYLLLAFEASPANMPKPDIGTPKLYPNWEARVATDKTNYWVAGITLDIFEQHRAASVALRQVASGLTIDITVAQQQEQGFVTGAQFNAECKVIGEERQAVIDLKEETDHTIKSFATGSMLQGIRDAFELTDVAPPHLSMAYSNLYTAKAKDGVYMPILNSGRDNPFLSPIPRDVALIAGDGTIYGTHADVALPGWNFGVVWFEQVHSSTAFRLKSRHVMEYVPLAEGILATATPCDEIDDEVALKTIWRLRNRMPHAYPACYNSWGWLGDLLEGAAGLIPGVGPFIKPFVKPAFNWIGGKVSDFFGNPVMKDGDVWYDAQ